jgi:branched-chain amino acid transport system substrate-binding protein
MQESIVIGEGEAEDPDLHLFDDAVKGFHSSIYYSSTLDTPENTAFKDSLKQKFGPTALPSTFTLGAYDAMGLVFKMLETQTGQKFDGAAAIETIKGYSWTSPRGKVTLDPATREPIEDFVIREVKQTPDGYRNVVIGTFPQVNPSTFAAGG